MNLYGYCGNDSVNLVDPLGLLSDAAWKIVDEAMKANDEDLLAAYADVLQQREELNRRNPGAAGRNDDCPPALKASRDAEHFLFSAAWTSVHPWIAAPVLFLTTPGYSVIKIPLIPFPRSFPNTSRPSYNEVVAGYEGVGYGWDR